MYGWSVISLLCVALALAGAGLIRRLKTWRSLLFGSGLLAFITALSLLGRGNAFGQYLFVTAAGSPRLPMEAFGTAWWLLGAWLINGLLDRVLLRTLFPNDNEPHARRLFADLASVLVYLVALVGIMDTVFKQPISAVLTTSGIAAIILGLALQNTLADVFSGLAINIERSFRAGDWVTLPEKVEGQIMEINWRAARIKTDANDLIVIPNSVFAKAIVVNHSPLSEPHDFPIILTVSHLVSPARVLATLEAAALGCPGLATGATPKAYACEFQYCVVVYELIYSIDDFTRKPIVQSDLVVRVVDAFQDAGIVIGAPELNVRLARRAGLPAAAIRATSAQSSGRSSLSLHAPP
jgi:small-conductance mechanosensitive channel